MVFYRFSTIFNRIQSFSALSHFASILLFGTDFREAQVTDFFQRWNEKLIFLKLCSKVLTDILNGDFLINMKINIIEEYFICLNDYHQKAHTIYSR